jgi:hypothetical protein
MQVAATRALPVETQSSYIFKDMHLHFAAPSLLASFHSLRSQATPAPQAKPRRQR